MPSFTSKTSVQIPRLEGEDVHVWKLKLSDSLDGLSLAVLSEEEVEKVSRLRSSKLRARALSMRVQLRQLLSLYLDLKPIDIHFQHAEFGKPSIINSALSFNVSHSADTALVAIGLCRELGVDIEQWRELDNLDGLVQRNFSSDEKEQWLSINDEEKQQTFFNIWTCKEAFIKATGRGLGMGVRRCTFNLQSPHELRQCPEQYGEATDWRCVPLEFDGPLSATLMVGANACAPLIFEFDSDNFPEIA
ncbi:MAG: 4'-phosphopantetheinyl transferase superfamily protein [Cycloclasticus sp.]